LGFDLAGIERIRQILKNNPKITDRLFTDNELAYSKQFSESAPHLAACFCAKEAYFKALGTGLATHRWKDVELLHKPSGEPYLHHLGKPVEGQVSISHTEEIAGGVVILF
jgi:holo-[acyl-carrier protein] synthase